MSLGKRILRTETAGMTVFIYFDVYDRRIEGESDMIYFDNAATTCVFPEVVEAMQDAMQVTYGNPSAKHMKGIESRE